NLQGRNQVGKVKSEALQRVREQLFQALVRAVDESPETWYRNILLNNTAGRDEEVLMASPEAKRLGKKFIDQVNQEKGTIFTYGGQTNTIDRGFVMKKKGMILTFSLHSLVEEVFRSNEGDIAKILFQDDGL
ncbi:MAG TPA: hypothetical protein VLH40_07385, partial [Atribacteraceae bacterium]|nr:hypothetical protein [Atribacteraceae bacterium]